MKSLVFILILFLCVTICYAQDEQLEPSFIGRIKADDVNVRAGYNQNFESLTKLNRDDVVFVAGELYGWYQISLPKISQCYLSKQYIELHPDDSSGISKVDNLNVRARASLNSSIVGQLHKGEKVMLLDELEDWYKIEPTDSCFGWVSAKYVDKHKEKDEENEND